MKQHIKFFQLVFLFLFLPRLAAQQDVTLKLYAPSASQSVHVCGDFNNWSKTANPMHDAEQDKVWEITLRLQTGQYEYRYLIDGTRWIKDPDNNDWGGERSNSILWVKSPYQPEIIHIKPKTGSVIPTPMVYIFADYVDGIGKFGIDLEKTKVYLNGQIQTFSFNPDLNRMEICPGQLKDGEYQIEIEAQDKQGNQAKKVSTFFVVNAVNTAPHCEAGYTIIAAINSNVQLNGGISYDPDKEAITKYDWNLIQKPAGSKSRLKGNNTLFPTFMPDKVGKYVITLQLSDQLSKSKMDTVDVHAFIQRNYPVEFRLADSDFYSIYEETIDSVSVVGEFNQWSASASPMFDYDNDDVWTTWLNLDPGEYEYKFVVNGKHWITDPSNSPKVPDGWQGYNSVVHSSLNLKPVINVKTSFAPGKIIFDASASHSQIGNKLTFLWYQDINNPQKFNMENQQTVSISTPKLNGTYFFYLVVKDKYQNTARKTIMLDVDQGRVKIDNFSQSPEWANDVIVYEVYLRKFHPQSNFHGLIEKLPYLKTLGIHCIWLMPVYESPTEHGYGPTDFFEIEDDYGTNEDFKIFVQKAHEMGMKIIFDFVANHSSDQHPYFVSAFKNTSSVFRDWYVWKPRSEQNPYYSYEFYNDWDALPNLNYDNPNVRYHMLQSAKFWANLGVDGFRCDVAWGLPHNFWKIFRRTLKKINPEILLINEVLPRSPDYHKDEFDMSYDTDFYGNLLDVFDGKKPLSSIEYGLQKTKKNYPPNALNLRYLENHDMERFINRYGREKTKLAATLLLTIPGTPMILYGQEIGLKEQLPLMNWEGQDDDLMQYYKNLILLRRHNLSLRRGEMKKIATNHDDQVYAYLRVLKDELFLVILNFGDKLEECQLLLPEENFDIKGNYHKQLKNVLSGELQTFKIYQNNKIKFPVESLTPYVFKLIQ